MGHAALEGTQHQALEEREELVDSGQHHDGAAAVLADEVCLMADADVWKALLGRQAVGDGHGVLLDVPGRESLARLDACPPHLLVRQLDGSRHQRLVPGRAAAAVCPVIGAADVRHVHLQRARQRLLPEGDSHARAQSMAPMPRHLVVHAQLLRELLFGDRPLRRHSLRNGPKPEVERLSRLRVERRACSYGLLVPAALALLQSPRRHRPGLPARALQAPRVLWPLLPLREGQVRVLRREALFELDETLRKIVHPALPLAGSDIQPTTPWASLNQPDTPTSAVRRLSGCLHKGSGE